MSKGLTPSQTIGPFYWGTLVNAYRCDLAPPGVAGERIELALSLHDVEGALVPDGLIEIWQANSHGRYNHPTTGATCRSIRGFEGFGRASTDARAWRISPRCGPAACRGPRAACRRRTSASPSSPVACSTGWRRGSISTAIRRCRRIRCWKEDRAGTARHADRQARRRRPLASADPSRGPAETVFFDV